MALPDTEFYLRCIRKCRAVRESERSANVRALLESHDLCEAALADLPPAWSSEGPPPSRDAASVALARLLRAYVVMDGEMIHPFPPSVWLVSYLEPVLTVAHAHGPGAAPRVRFEQHLVRVPFPPAGDERAGAALGILVRTIVAASRMISPGEGHRALKACLGVLDAAGDAVDAALVRLAATAGGSGPRLPTAAELRIACLAPIVLEQPPGLRRGSLSEYRSALERLLQLEPEHPRALYRLAEMELSRERWEASLPLLRRAHEAAKKQRNDNYIAVLGFQLVIATSAWRDLAYAGRAVQGGLPRPSELLALLREANAACTRSERLLPSGCMGWAAGKRSMAARMETPLQLTLEHQGDSLRAPPGHAGIDIEQVIKAAVVRNCEDNPAPEEVLARRLWQVTCSGCGIESIALRKCSACKQAQYCRCARAAAMHATAPPRC